MSQKGQHTWDISVHYHRCPKCGFIIEDRQEFQLKDGKWVKDVTCEECGEDLQFEKARKAKFGPLIGTPQPPEFDWN